MIAHDGATAANIWASEPNFQSKNVAQKNTRHIELHNMAQGDTSIKLSYTQIKAISNELCEGDTISDSQLINMVFVSLNGNYDKHISFIR
jgi:hypothetical protein